MEKIHYLILLSCYVILVATDGTGQNSDDDGVTKSEPKSVFPSINTLAKSDSHSFSIPQPSLDLDPTSLSVNAPMIMSLPELQSNLDEPDFAKNFRMDFSITQPKLDLEPSFSTDPLPALASSPKAAEDEGDQAAVIEVVEEDTNEEKPKKDLRNKRDGTKLKYNLLTISIKFISVSKFPSIFSLMSSDHIPISFPTPDLTPRYPCPFHFI